MLVLEEAVVFLNSALREEDPKPLTLNAMAKSHIPQSPQPKSIRHQDPEELPGFTSLGKLWKIMVCYDT